MPAYIQLPDIPGEVQEVNHSGWVEVNSVSLPIHRSIQAGATGVARNNGETTLGDIVVYKTWDSSTPKMAKTCADGKYMGQVKIDLCSMIGGQNVVNLSLTLKNVIISSYSFSATGDQSPVPSETITLNYTAIDWNYIKYKDDGSKDSNFPATYDTQTAVAG